MRITHLSGVSLACLLLLYAAWTMAADTTSQPTKPADATTKPADAAKPAAAPKPTVPAPGKPADAAKGTTKGAPAPKAEVAGPNAIRPAADAPAVPEPKLAKTPTKETFKAEWDEKYGKIALPSRVVGIGFPDLKKCPFLTATVFNQLDIWEESRIGGKATMFGWPIDMFVDFQAPNPSGPREAIIMVGRWGQLYNEHWKKMSDTKVTINGQSGYIDTKKNYPEAKKDKDKKAGQSLAAAAEKKTLAGSDKELKKFETEMIEKALKTTGKKPTECDLKGKSWVFPVGLIPSRKETDYWNYVFSDPGCYIDGALDQSWLYEYKKPKDAPRLLVAMILPDPKTKNTAFFRNCCVMRANVTGGAGDSGPKILTPTSTTQYVPVIRLSEAGELETEIMLFDDNLNGVFGEMGVDSMRVGGAYSLVGARVSVGGRVYDMRYTQERTGSVGNAELKPVETPTGAIQLYYNGDSALAQICQVSREKDFYGLVTRPLKEDADKKRGPIRYEPVAVPVGVYKITGGLIFRPAERDTSDSYAAFMGGYDIVVEEGKTTVVRMGHPVEPGKFMGFDLKITSDQSERRTVKMAYLTGLAGEQYREFFPRTRLPMLIIQSTVDKTLKTEFTFEQNVDGGAFMETGFPFDRAVMNPKNGPFTLDTEVETGIFRPQKIHMQIPNL